MADSQDNLTPSEQKKLAELEQQVGKEKSVKQTAKPGKSVATENTAKSPETHTAAPIVADAKSSSSHSTARHQNEKGRAKTGGLWFFTILNLLLILGMISAGYWAWLQWQAGVQQQKDAITQQQSALNQQQKSVAQQQSEIAQSIDNNQLAKTELQQNNQALQSQIESQIQSLSEKYQLVNGQVVANQRNLADISGRRPADWLLAEADYLVRMAGRKLWLEHDVKTAIMMLQSADSRIQDLDDPSLLPLRALLAEDLQQLQQIRQVSTSSIALNLGAMIKQVDSLPLSFFKRPEAAPSDTVVTESVDDWQSNLRRNWDAFKKDFFSFKQVTTEIKPFMSEQQQWLSRQQLKFALMQAQNAVLQEDQSLYGQFLQSALDVMSEYFDNDKALVVQFNKNLNDLLLTDFERQYPEQFNTTEPLNDVIERRLDSRFVNGSN